MISKRVQGFTESVIREMTPGSSFDAHPELGRTKIRFCFPKTDDLLTEAGRRLTKLAR